MFRTLFFTILAATTTGVAVGADDLFSFQQVHDRARSLAAADYSPPEHPLPDYFAQLDYDGYRKIRFRRDTALWNGTDLPFTVQFFHRGYLFRAPVKIHVVEDGRASELRFSPAQFDYGSSDTPQPVPEDLGYAGFRLLDRDGAGDAMREFASFLGGSYYRLVGSSQVYGASARGLSIDTAEPSGEEFPVFREFWIVKPTPGDESLEVLALLDSARMTGAFRLSIHPGTDTRIEVHAELFSRDDVRKLGVAPLTSMYLFGERSRRNAADYRPEVHDSDGLVIATADGSWTWLPLNNPKETHRVTRSPADGLRGFGLLQRDRDFRSYQDLESRFEKRPSLWVETIAGFDNGFVELVEIPTDHEWNDNIVAYYVPSKSVEGEQELSFDYVVHAKLQTDGLPPLARSVSSWTIPDKDGALTRFIVDFQGPGVDAESAGALLADVSVSSGEVIREEIQPNDPIGGVRLFVDVRDADDGVTVTARLHRDDTLMSETWTCRHWKEPR